MARGSSGAPRRMGRSTRPTGRRRPSTHLALLVLTADCLPVAYRRQAGGRDAPRRLARAGGRDPRGGRRGAARAGRRRASCTRRSGPARAAAATRSGRKCTRAFGRPAERGPIDLKAIARERLNAAGVSRAPRRRRLHDLQRPVAVLLASPRRRRHRPAGGDRVAELIHGLDATRIRERVAEATERIAQAARRAGRGPQDVELLAAVKYVPLDELGALSEAGLTLLGENRAQELVAKAAAWPGRADFTWDFIGHLQSPQGEGRRSRTFATSTPSRATARLSSWRGTARRRPRCSSR